MTGRPPADLAADVRRALDTLTDVSFVEADDAAMHEDSLNAYDALDSLVARIDTLTRERNEYRIEADHGHDDYEDAEDVIRQIAEARKNQPFDPWARGLCQEFLDRPRRSRDVISAIRQENERLRRHPDAWSQEAFDQQKARAEAAEAALADTRRALADAIHVAVLLTGAADLSEVEAWPEMRDKLFRAMPFRRALAAGSGPQEQS